ncbi:cell division protein ZipA C-terminal FtsZ-binding domain-containing protein [Halomonas sp. SpR8]|uniref:cell division protein ZipA C-terminal FtsZ-binding domain-containing protein n=1 Tax=Halomonas sp. SpR8 TaxID=3050463 RepID=UPI0027E50E5F|nr:cell division protein ZipA C-terminal FtsZ-binding domain-containing protein [Halomonas sp. SpR8]MDQ7727938.1 cell division protein ZipA C-terminal FtsZ-binding domain-containing protein [Halomonas sp. SpR8]
MELREWLIILGLALVSLIVIDGARRFQRQRRVPRLDLAGKDASGSSLDDPDEAAKEAEINWELPNGGARVVKPADYSGLGNKPKLERQEHPGPSRVLAEFRRSASAKAAKRKADKADKAASIAQQPTAAAMTADPVASSTASSTPTSMPTEHERREPSLSMTDKSTADTSNAHVDAAVQPPHEAEQSAHSPVASSSSDETVNEAAEHEPMAAKPAATDAMSISASDTASDPEKTAQPSYDAEPVLRAEPEDAVFAKHANEHSPKRRQLRSDTVGEQEELDDHQVDEYRLVDFEGMGRSLKRRLIELRKEKQRKKAEKAVRDKALAKQKAERKALEAEQRREAKEAADAERARLAQEQAQAREAAANAAAAERLSAQQRLAEEEALRYEHSGHAGYEENSYDEGSYSEEHLAGFDDQTDYASDMAYDDRAAEERVRVHPTLEKALRHDVSGEHAKETLSNAEEVVVISILSRDPEGFDGSKLLELMMVCGLRYSREMGIFHRFETESEDSELQFSMVNIVKPGTFPIEEMDEFMTPGITLLMPLPGAIDSSAAFEAMVETAMVVVRHMGGELKDENRSVMTAQTIEFARQRVREFERRHRLHRHMQAR